MKRSQITVLLGLVCLFVVLALPALARADATDGFTWDESAATAEPAPEGATSDESAATAEQPAPDGWTWDEAAAPADPAPDGGTSDESPPGGEPSP